PRTPRLEPRPERDPAGRVGAITELDASSVPVHEALVVGFADVHEDLRGEGAVARLEPRSARDEAVHDGRAAVLVDLDGEPSEEVRAGVRPLDAAPEH